MVGPIIRAAGGLLGEIAMDVAEDAVTPDDAEDQMAKLAQYAMWQPVSSSAISAVRWDPSAMEVRFQNGYEYAYPGVPMEVFEDFLGASSKGRYLNANIKPSYG